MFIPILATAIYAAILLLVIVLGLMLLSKIRLKRGNTGRISLGFIFAICALIFVNSLVHTGTQTTNSTSDSSSTSQGSSSSKTSTSNNNSDYSTTAHSK